MAATLVVAPIWSDDWSGQSSRVGGVILLVAGAIFGIPGALQLGRNRTIFPEPRPGSGLVTDGIFAWVRHPLYTSVILLSFAWALWWRSGPALVLAFGTAGFLDLKGRFEERRLRKCFKGYEDYSSRVKRLVPFLY